jgi:hypothetical protein
MRVPLITAIAAGLTLLPLDAGADDAAEAEFFEQRIRPALVEHCAECHATNAKKIGGGLLLDHREGARKGGESGPAIVPGKPNHSLLIKAIRFTNDSLQMPPKGKLPAKVIADFEAWVKRGAYDPRDKPPQTKVENSWEETLQERSRWWSLQPVQRPPTPMSRDAGGSAHAVDRFLLAKQETSGLKPAEIADPRTLARRLSFVLTGLPLPAEKMEAVVRIERGEPQAYEQLVDSLLASPHFGERWARHWMDVVRFSETHGNEWNYEVHHAWRYRDYLIRAFNADLPYDQFIREHIAGDLLPQPRWNRDERFNESVIGTAFYRFGEVNHDDCISLRSIGYDLADNQIDTLTKAFQATTVACARCHNHKLDAVSMEDYYALLGVLRSSRLVSHCLDAPEVNADALERMKSLKKELRKELAEAWLTEAKQIGQYLQPATAQRDGEEGAAGDLDPLQLEKWAAAAALEKTPLEEPLSPWRKLMRAEPAAFSAQWQQLKEQIKKEDHERTEYNRSNFETFADFGQQDPAGWQTGGQALRGGPNQSGEWLIYPEGAAIVRAILPAGRYTSALSDKLNGTLRSPVIPLGKKHISFLVAGQRSSAVRLVSNHCQLNYKNYKALTSSDLHWETFSPPDDRNALQTYAELLTMFDNPKFPDQLSALGGDKENYRLPWEQAAKNPRSWFGITRVVLHDVAGPPKPGLAHLRPLFADPPPASLAAFATRYQETISAAITAWRDDKGTDDDALWLDWLVRRDLLPHHAQQSARIKELLTEYRQLDAGLALPRVSPGIAEGGAGIEQPLFIRGDCFKPGPTIPRRYLEVLTKSREPFHASGSGRMELANRIACADNPLTARVLVNRVWHHLFGTGIVRTVDDFGHVGDLPSHPELLDHLASQFVADGWSIKRLIRSLVLTKTFQQSSAPSEAARQVDPQNRLLSHYSARRLDAEAVRDSMLAVSGRLDSRLYGPSVQPFRDKAYPDRRLFPGPLDGDGRRSIYIKNNLMEAPKFLAAFNLPGGKVAQGRRDVTNVPAQALAMLNDPFVLQQADVWAGGLVARRDDTLAQRIEAMYQAALGRPPTAEERQAFENAIHTLAELHHVPAAEVLASRAVWKDAAHAIFNLSEFLYVP